MCKSEQQTDRQKDRQTDRQTVTFKYEVTKFDSVAWYSQLSHIMMYLHCVQV